MFINNPNFKYLVIVGLVIVSAMLLNIRIKKKFDVFEPFYLISILYFLIFSIAPTIWIIEERTGYAGVNAMVNTPYASIIFIIGYLSFSTLYIFSKPADRSLKTASDEESKEYQQAVVQWAWVAYIISFIMTLIKYAMQGRSFIELMTFSRYETNDAAIITSAKLLFLGQFPRVMYTSILILIAFQLKHRWQVFLAYVICLNIAISSGWRNQIIFILIAPLIMLYLMKEKRPKWTIVAFVTIILFIAMGVIGLWRGSIRSGTALQHISARQFFNSFMVNIEVFFPFYHMVGFIPNKFPYQLGMSYLNAFIQFIPRDLWAGKPYSPMKNFFEAIYGTQAANGPAFPNLGEMYMEFGLIGVLVLMGVFGFIVKKLYGYVFSKDKLDIIVFSILMGYMFFYITRGYFPTICMDLISMLAPVWIIRFLTTYQRKRY